MSAITDAKKLKRHVRRALRATRKVAERSAAANRWIQGCTASGSIKSESAALATSADSFKNALIAYKATL